MNVGKERAGCLLRRNRKNSGEDYGEFFVTRRKKDGKMTCFSESELYFLYRHLKSRFRLISIRNPSYYE